MGIGYHKRMSEQRMGVRELREQLGKRIDAAHFHGEPTVIEKNGEPRAVLISYAQWVTSRDMPPENVPARS
jgi:prevent-host-death family protein